MSDATDSQVIRFCKQLAHRSFRDERKLFLIEGVRAVCHAVDAGFQVTQLIRSRPLLQSVIGRKYLRQLIESGTPCRNVSAKGFRSFSTLPRASGIAAVVRMQNTTLAEIRPEHGNCWIIVSRVRSAGNLGSLCRSVDAAGGAGLILVGNDIDPFSPELIRASMGAYFRRPIVRTTWNQFAKWQRSKNWTTVGATPNASTSFRDAQYTNPTLLMLGEERRGLSTRQTAHCDQFVRIPVRPETDSLNVAVAGSLIAYEIQRRFPNSAIFKKTG